MLLSGQHKAVSTVCCPSVAPLSLCRVHSQSHLYVPASHPSYISGRKRAYFVSVYAASSDLQPCIRESPSHAKPASLHYSQATLSLCASVELDVDAEAASRLRKFQEALDTAKHTHKVLSEDVSSAANSRAVSRRPSVAASGSRGSARSDYTHELSSDHDNSTVSSTPRLPQLARARLGVLSPTVAVGPVLHGDFGSPKASQGIMFSPVKKPSSVRVARDPEVVKYTLRDNLKAKATPTSSVRDDDSGSIGTGGLDAMPSVYSTVSLTSLGTTATQVTSPSAKTLPNATSITSSPADAKKKRRRRKRPGDITMTMSDRLVNSIIQSAGVHELQLDA